MTTVDLDTPVLYGWCVAERVEGAQVVGFKIATRQCWATRVVQSLNVGWQITERRQSRLHELL